MEGEHRADIRFIIHYEHGFIVHQLLSSLREYTLRVEPPRRTLPLDP